MIALLLAISKLIFANSFCFDKFYEWRNFNKKRKVPV